ncbi:hypothetical protein SCHPADRAFT_942607 [Schizopora paradoxa]|uniref:Uncharacterized protein n=1 Tax=Schizopora paradoxa TaxID=27342 RepID=A0A0H2RFT6_9AGAM|nr:hypothetical protein SCHPADRAFT_942607 [Schizopora paradoxa]
MRVGIHTPSILVLAGLNLSKAQITTNATCLSQFSYLFNAEGQSPCLVAAYLNGACHGGQYSMKALKPGDHYIGPTVASLSSCKCSTVTYSMVFACGACQNGKTVNWSAWNVACSNVYVGVFPEDIPVGTSVPAWAYSNVTVTDTFNPQVAIENTAPDSTATKSLTTQTATNFLNNGNEASGINGNKKKSNAGSIAGGIVGGAALLCLVGFFTLRRHLRRKDGALIYGDETRKTDDTSMLAEADPYMLQTALNASGGRRLLRSKGELLTEGHDTPAIFNTRSLGKETNLVEAKRIDVPNDESETALTPSGIHEAGPTISPSTFPATRALAAQEPPVQPDMVSQAQILDTDESLPPYSEQYMAPESGTVAEVDRR